MSHEIRKQDAQQGRKMGWHKKTDVIPDLSMKTDKLWLRQWDAAPVSIVAKRSDGSEVTLPQGETWEALISEQVLVGGETALFVSTPYNRETYTPLLNVDFLRIIEDALVAAGLPTDVESCGSVFNRRRVFLSIPIPGGETFEAGGRVFQGFINFLNSFDMSCPFMVIYSNHCVVCNNTFNSNMDVGGLVVQHSKNMAAKLENVPAIVAAALEAQESFRSQFLKMHSTPVSLEQAKGLIVSFLCDGAKLSTRSFNDSEEITRLFVKGAGNKGETLADVFSALTDFYSHFSAGEDKEKQFQSSEFGAGALAKQQAMAFLAPMSEDSEELNAQATRGHELTTAYFTDKLNKEKVKLGKKLTALEKIALCAVAVVPPPVPVVPVATVPEVAPTPAPAKGKAKAKKAKGSK